MELIPFTYGDAQVRVVQIDGEPWFVLADICRVLDIANPSRVAASLDSDALRSTEVIDSLGRIQQAKVTDESGLYAVIFQSRKPEAKDFRRWVTHDVLPSIRRTGTYGQVQQLTGPELMAKALIEAHTVLEAKDQQIAALEPKARSWDHLSNSAGDYSIGDAAKVLSRDPEIVTGQNRLFKKLADLGWIFRSNAFKGGGWRAYQSRVDAGHLVERIPPLVHHPETGDPIVKPPQIRITAKGLGALHRALGGRTAIDDLTAEQAELVTIS